MNEKNDGRRTLTRARAAAPLLCRAMRGTTPATESDGRARARSPSSARAPRWSNRAISSTSAGIVQDSIVAEDLGRFPDANVADSLSHITGITISAHARRRRPVRERARPRARVQHRHAERPHPRDRRRRPRVRVRRAAVRGHLRRRRLQVRGRRASRRQHRRHDQSDARRDRSTSPACTLRFSVDGDYNDLSEKTGYKASGVFSNTFADDTHGRACSPRCTRTYRSALGRRARVLHQPGFARRVRRQRRRRRSPPTRATCSACAARASARASSRRSAPASPPCGSGRSATASA